MKDKKNKKQDRYAGIFNRIDHIERRILEIKNHITQIKDGTCLENDSDELCLDELESERAILEMMNVSAIDAIADTEPVGEA